MVVRISKIGWIFGIGLVACGVAFSLALVFGQGWWLPPAYTEYARQVDTLFYVILALTTIVGTAVMAAFVLFIVHYARGSGRKARYSHGNNTLEIVWTSITALILIFIGLVSKGLYERLQFGEPPGAMRIEVEAQQFQWTMRYAGTDKQFGTPDDVVMPNEMKVPQGRDVALRMRSKDVIHSFFLPHFRIKSDVVPGMTTRLWFHPTEVDRFEIVCAELCGTSHYRMGGKIEVLPAAEFDKWLRGEEEKVGRQAAAKSGGGGTTDAPARSGGAPGAGSGGSGPPEVEPAKGTLPSEAAPPVRGEAIRVSVDPDAPMRLGSTGGAR